MATLEQPSGGTAAGDSSQAVEAGRLRGSYRQPRPRQVWTLRDADTVPGLAFGTARLRRGYEVAVYRMASSEPESGARADSWPLSGSQQPSPGHPPSINVGGPLLGTAGCYAGVVACPCLGGGVKIEVASAVPESRDVDVRDHPRATLSGNADMEREHLW